MEYNLKNRPNWDKTDGTFIDYTNKFEQWFEGFKKELREELEDPDNIFLHPEAYNDLIKEILGE